MATWLPEKSIKELQTKLYEHIVLFRGYSTCEPALEPDAYILQ